MSCPSCGESSEGNFKFCPRCGYQYDLSVQRPVVWSQAPARKSDSKVLMIIIIVVVAAIVVPIILSALLYVMVLGFGGSSPEMTPAVSLSKSQVTGGVKFTLTPPTISTTWDDVGIVLTDSSESIGWHPDSGLWTYGNGIAVFRGAPQLLGLAMVWLNVTDIAGSGYAKMGDFFTITSGVPYGLSPATTYSVILMYEPTGGAMCEYSFTV